MSVLITMATANSTATTQKHLTSVPVVQGMKWTKMIQGFVEVGIFCRVPCSRQEVKCHFGVQALVGLYLIEKSLCLKWSNTNESRRLRDFSSVYSHYIARY